MTTITILPEEKNFRAVAGTKESVGRTIGEALDRLTEQLNEDEDRNAARRPETARR